MDKLIPYVSGALPNFEISSDLEILSQNKIRLTFQVQNKNSSIDFRVSSVTAKANQLPRKDELWKDICFELFLNPLSEKKYYEFNFSLQPAWNCYVFESYRAPQPPQASKDFEILSLTWSGSELKVELENRSAFTKFNAGITAIIKDKHNQTHYFALKHAGTKPDFHLQDSFILQRGF